MSSYRFAVLTILALLLAPVSVVGAPPTCDDPAASPTRLITWQQPHLAFEAAFDSNYIFLTEFNLVHRYALNGGAEVNFDAGFTVGAFAMSPLTGNLYAVSQLGDRRVFVFDQDGNAVATLFSGSANPNPGGIVGVSKPIAIDPNPADGKLYVLCEGWYNGGGGPQWISRIQRFLANGTYDGLLINNQLGIAAGDPGFDQQNPAFPACGAWHFPYQMMVDKEGSIYLWEGVNSSRQLEVVHKFAATGQCLGTWDVTGKRFSVDRDGYPYTAMGITLTKLKKDWSGTLYTRDMLGSISGIRFMPYTSDFLLAATSVGGGLTRNELFGPRVEPLDIIDEEWQSTASPYQLLTNNLGLLTKCDDKKNMMEGVVADGVSPLLLRWKVPGPGEVRWTLQDPNYPAIRSLLGTLASLDATAVDTVTIDANVKEVDDEYFAFAVYTAPKNFDRKEVSGDANVASRDVSVSARYFPMTNENPDLATLANLRIERPPVLFAHGLWSNPRAWRDFPAIANDPLWRAFTLNYETEHGRELSYHRSQNTVLKGIDNARRLVSDSIVKAQVDVVMHSMGGLLVRDFADGSNYESQANYGHGDFHKLLFLDTPHEGSPLADMMIQVRDIIGNPLVPSFTAIGMARRVNAVFTVLTLSVARRTSPEQITGKALDDLKTDSPEIASLQELVIPTHAHVGDASSYFSILTPDVYRGLFALTSAAASTALGMTTFLKLPASWPLLVNPSDLIVSSESQQGGLGSQYYLTVLDLPHSIHTEVTESPFAGDLAQEWAHRRADDITFFAPSIPAPTLSAAPSEFVPNSLEDSYKLMPNFSGRLVLTVTDPAGATTTFPGKVIKVRVQGPLTPQDSVMVYYPGGGLMGVYGNGSYGFSMPAGLPITIPLEHTGPFELLAIGENGDNRMFASHNVVIMVDPGAKVPPITVTDIRVEPSTVVLSGRGASERFQVTAECSDGIERDVSSTSLGTSYWPPSTGWWQVNADGVVVAKAPGTTTIVVANSGHSVTVPMTVLDGPQINNAPHADAGGPYAACDSQLVYLNGSASYDLDELLGETLTYAWDLDADGQFDDASGETPFAKLVFPGAYWLLGLKVTDSQGLESIDYAFLEAGPGCLDGEFICAASRNEASQAFVGIDGAGNVYVAEQTATANRVVKFSSSCDSIATFPISNELNSIAVTSNGTTYVPDSFPKGVWKYTSSGAESFLSLSHFLSKIAVDATGHIYGSDNSSTGLVRKFNSNGTANNTWNVGATFPIWEIAVGAGEVIYVASSDKIARGVLQGANYVTDWVVGEAGVDAGMFDSIFGLAVGPSGDLYVSDTDNDRIQRFKSDGTFVRLWTGSGKPTNGVFDAPEAIAVGSSEQVVVVDRQFSTWPMRAQVFGANSTTVNAELEAFTRYVGSATLYPQPTWPASGCPKGDGDHIVISVALDPSTVVGPVPSSAFGVSLPPGGTTVLYDEPEADSDATLIDGKYRTTITLRQFGGCLADQIIVKLNGAGIGSVPIDLRSPDQATTGISFGIVNITDFSWFAGHYPVPPQPYSPCADHRPTFGVMQIYDFGYYAQHDQHSIGGSALQANEVQAASGTLRLELIEEKPVIGGRRLWARLVLEGVEPFKAMLVSLRSDRPELNYLGWHPSSTYSDASMCTEIIRDGFEQVFVGVRGTASTASLVELGKVEFEIKGDEELDLADTDLAFLTAELLSVDETMRAFSGLRLERAITAPSYQFELAQNYPNPFNPSTTISFSVARSSDVTLTIFDVRGGLVKTLLRGRREAGVHRVPWDGADSRGARVASGVYFYRLTAGSFRDTRKMVLLR